MSALNPKLVKQVSATSTVQLSKNGNPQTVKPAHQVLFERVIGTLYGKDSYYETSHAKVVSMRGALNEVLALDGSAGAAYAGRLAIFARTHAYIRTMPIVLVVELAHAISKLNAPTLAKLKELDLAITSTGGCSAPRLKQLRDTLITFDLRSVVRDVIQRADELTDLYAYALTVFGSKAKVPMAIKRGVADAMNKFDAYQFGKYNRAVGVKLRDLLRLVHPKPVDLARAEIFSKLAADTLEPPYTWETELSKNGQLPKAEQKPKGVLWGELIAREGSGSIGYTALLSNLRNMHEAGISTEAWQAVCEKLANPKLVERSKVLPFTFINAYEVASHAGLPQLVRTA